MIDLYTSVSQLDDAKAVNPTNFQIYKRGSAFYGGWRIAVIASNFDQDWRRGYGHVKFWIHTKPGICLIR